MLPGADQALAVADLGVARDRADRRVAEGLDQLAYGGRLEDGVAVHHHDDVVRGRRDAGVECAGLAAVDLADQPDERQVHLLDDVRGAVRRAVVDDDHLDRMIADGQGCEGVGYALALVVGRDQYGDRLGDPRSPDIPPLGAAGVDRCENEHQREPAEVEEADEGQQRDQHRQRVHGELGGPDESLAGPQLETVHRHGGAGGAECLGDGGEAVALGLQPVDDLYERGDGLGTVAARVVQQDQFSRAGLGRHRCLDYLLDAGTLPVVGVAVDERGEVAARAHVLDHRVVPVVQRRGIGGVRRAEQCAVDARDARQRQLRLRHLPADPGVGLVHQIGVGEGVHAEFVAARDDLPDQLRVARGHRAGHEEVRTDVAGREHLQDLRSPLRRGTVVEAQNHGAVGDVIAHGVLVLGAPRVDDRAPLEQVVRHGRLVDRDRDPGIVERLVGGEAAQDEEREQAGQQGQRHEEAQRWRGQSARPEQGLPAALVAGQ